jgi:NitT/TauT family transport system ATP-binding protein
MTSMPRDLDRMPSAQGERESAGDADSHRPVEIEVDRVSLSLGGNLIVSDVSFDVRRGELVTLVGPSGCGKTTLLRLAAGLMRPDRGEIRVDGQRIVRPSLATAVVFQDYGRALLPWRDAADNVMLALEAARVERSKRRAIVDAVLAKVGLGAHANHYPSELSGGMQQRLQIARCLAQDPRVLLMDEPFGALDAMTREGLQDELLKIAAERSATILFVTHDLDEALYLSDRVIALASQPGRIAQIVDIPLPRPRSQVATREHPSYLPLRRVLFDLMHRTHP